MAITSSNAKAVKISRRSVLRDRAQRRAGRVAADQNDHRRSRRPPWRCRATASRRTQSRGPLEAAARCRPAGWRRCPGTAARRTPSAPSVRVEEAALGHRLHRDGGRRERQREPGDRAPPATAGRVASPPAARAGCRRRSICKRAAAEYARAHRPQAIRIELQADDEQHEDDAELGEVQDGLDVAHQAEPERADQAAGEQVAEHGAESQAARERHEHHRGRQVDGRIDQEPALMPSSGISSCARAPSGRRDSARRALAAPLRHARGAPCTTSGSSQIMPQNCAVWRTTAANTSKTCWCTPAGV